MARCHDLSALMATSAAEHLDESRIGLMDRWSPVADWMAGRLAEGFDASSKSHVARIGPRVVGRDRAGRGLSGINFAMEDPLSLSAHPGILTAASAAIRRYGVHAAGSASQMGLCALGRQLEDQLANHLGCAEATLFPCGWSAAFGALRTLLRDGDHVLICGQMRDGVRQGAVASGAVIHQLPEPDSLTLAERLDYLRDHHPQAGILLAVTALDACDPRLPDLARLQALCRRYAATLLVDVSDDLGLMGDSGRGVIEMQGQLGQIDVVIGSLAGVFAANGGFVASPHPALKTALRLASGAQTESAAMSPVQAAVALAALEIVTGEQGVIRRARLATNVARLRAGLKAAGFSPEPSPGPVALLRFAQLEHARRLTSEMLAHGVIVNLEETPGPRRDEPHPLPPLAAGAAWRLRVMADHSPEDIDTLIARLVEARQRLLVAERQGWEARLAVVA